MMIAFTADTFSSFVTLWQAVLCQALVLAGSSPEITSDRNYSLSALSDSRFSNVFSWYHFYNTLSKSNRKVFVSAFVMQKYQVLFSGFTFTQCSNFYTINRQKTAYIFVKSFDG